MSDQKTALDTAADEARLSKNEAQARYDAILDIRDALRSVLRRGFPAVSGVDADGNVVLRVELENWVAPIVEPPDLDQPAPEEEADQLDTLCAQIVAAPPPVPAPDSPDIVPRPIRPNAERPAPTQKWHTGPLSDAERDEIVAMTVAGKSVKEISHALRRNCASVGRARGYLKERIEDARDLAKLSQSDAPDTETPPTPAEGAATPDAVAEGTSEGGDHSPALAPEPEPRPFGKFRADIPAPDAFTYHEREINAHLNALAYADWCGCRTIDADADLFICNEICAGRSKALGTKPILGVTVSRSDCLSRWRALNTDIGNLDHQAALLRVLKYRATEGQR